MSGNEVQQSLPLFYALDSALTSGVFPFKTWDHPALSSNLQLKRIAATPFLHRRWVRRPSLPEPRAYCTALVIHHELWLAGGLKPSGKDPTGFSNVVDVLAYHSQRSRWEFRFMLSRPRHGVAAASADDRIYVVGGMVCQTGASVDDVDVYHRQRFTFLDCQFLPKRLTGEERCHRSCLVCAIPRLACCQRRPLR
ncbi:hypothetical protein HPB48_017094 [Haemaphysalis longicornis]|uniref:Uncharacterized protein n=1 Tax=Haemaphysalis longicornis TaxID=44386 RepID=A0A9J6GJA2_HAELO|nr:hypothetical protein HPB48_017094 [Haemaphysalis longicornis]